MKIKFPWEKFGAFNVSWHITDRCNYNCEFCFRPVHGKELTLSEAKKVIDKLALIGLKKISWSGGEPLLWRGIEDLIEYTKKKGISTMIISNGELMGERDQKKLLENLDWLNLPLEGPNAEMNELMSRKKGHFGRTIKLMEWANKNKINLKINTVASRINKDEIINMVPFIKKYKVKRWKIFQFYPIRWVSRNNRSKFQMKESDFLRIKEEVEKLMEGTDCMVVFESNKDMDRSYFAIAPDSSVFVSLNGQDSFIGNLLKDEPKLIWQNPLIDKVKYWNRSKWLLNK